MSATGPDPLKRPGPRRWLVAVGLLTAAVAGSGYWLAPWRETPEEVWAEVSAAAAAGDYGAVWDRMDPGYRGRLRPDLDGFPGPTDRDRFVQLLDARPDVRRQFLPETVLRVEVRGDWAAVHLDRPDPGAAAVPTGGVNMVRVKGRWYLCHGDDVPW